MFQDAVFSSLPPAALRCWRLEWLLFFAIAALLVCVLALPVLEGGLRTFLFYCAASCVPLYLLFFWLCGRSYRRLSFALTAQALVIRRGIWFRRETVVPRARVQYVDVRQGPLGRRFDLATLVVVTAGSQLASVKLEDVSYAEAQAIRTALAGEAHDAR